MQVAKKLEEEQGISVEVVDLRSLRPLDRPTIINSVKKTNRAVVIEEDWRSYGIGAEIAATIQEEAFDYLDAPVRRVAGLEVPLPYAAHLSRASKPDAQDLDRRHSPHAGRRQAMAEVTMPRLSDTMSEGAVGRWLKKPGDKVQTDEVIAEIETDKATMDLVSFEDGTLQEILVPEGKIVPIGEAIGIIGNGPAKAAPKKDAKPREGRQAGRREADARRRRRTAPRRKDAAPAHAAERVREGRRASAPAQAAAEAEDAAPTGRSGRA